MGRMRNPVFGMLLVKIISSLNPLLSSSAAAVSDEAEKSNQPGQRDDEMRTSQIMGEVTEPGREVTSGPHKPMPVLRVRS